MDPYAYRIGKDRALFVVSCMWLIAASIVGTMTYPSWARAGDENALSLAAIAAGQVNLFDSAERAAVGEALRSNGVVRRPGQSWTQVLQSLSTSKVSVIAQDLEKQLGPSGGDLRVASQRRRTARPTNTGQGRIHKISRGVFAIPGAAVAPGAMLVPGAGPAPWQRMLRGR